MLNPETNHSASLIYQLTQETPRDTQAVWAWFFDWDGTLVDLAPAPDQIQVPWHLVDDLTQLASHPNHYVSLVSGRQITDLQHWVPGSSLFMSGNHGAEYFLGQDIFLDERVQQTQATMEKLSHMLSSVSQQFPGTVLEDKRHTLSFHYRHMPPSSTSALKTAISDIMKEYQPQLTWSDAKMCFEFRARDGATKGDAVTTLLSHIHGLEPGKTIIPIILGDDRTDEDAFQAHPHAITIHVGLHRPTLAEFRLPSPQSVRTLLHHLVKSLRSN